MLLRPDRIEGTRTEEAEKLKSPLSHQGRHWELPGKPFGARGRSSGMRKVMAPPGLRPQEQGDEKQGVDMKVPLKSHHEPLSEQTDPSGAVHTAPARPQPATGSSPALGETGTTEIPPETHSN